MLPRRYRRAFAALCPVLLATCAAVAAPAAQDEFSLTADERSVIIQGDGNVVVSGPGRAAGAVNGSGRVRSESREARNFRAVEAYGGIQLILVQGDAEGVRIDAEDNLLPLLESRVEGGVLRVGPRRGVVLAPRRLIRYTIRLRALDSLDLSGAVMALAKRLRTSGDLRLDVSGSSSLLVGSARVGGTLTADISGASSADIAGSAPRQRVILSGSSVYKAAHLTTRDTTLSASGASDARVRALRDLDVDASGASEVRYSGEARLKQRTSGASTVTPLPAR